MDIRTNWKLSDRAVAAVCNVPAAVSSRRALEDLGSKIKDGDPALGLAMLRVKTPHASYIP
jgi:hypothetical protein